MKWTWFLAVVVFNSQAFLSVHGAPSQASLVYYSCGDTTCTASTVNSAGPFPSDRCCNITSVDEPSFGVLFDTKSNTLILNSIPGCGWTSGAWRLPVGTCFPFNVPPTTCSNIAVRSVDKPCGCPSGENLQRAHRQLRSLINRSNLHPH